MSTGNIGKENLAFPLYLVALHSMMIQLRFLPEFDTNLSQWPRNGVCCLEATVGHSVLSGRNDDRPPRLSRPSVSQRRMLLGAVLR